MPTHFGGVRRPWVADVGRSARLGACTYPTGRKRRTRGIDRPVVVQVAQLCASVGYSAHRRRGAKCTAEARSAMWARGADRSGAGQHSCPAVTSLSSGSVTLGPWPSWRTFTSRGSASRATSHRCRRSCRIAGRTSTTWPRTIESSITTPSPCGPRRGGRVLAELRAGRATAGAVFRTGDDEGRHRHLRRPLPGTQRRHPSPRDGARRALPDATMRPISFSHQRSRSRSTARAACSTACTSG
jgi:hypothetical protein